jgi:hypothetical protein
MPQAVEVELWRDYDPAANRLPGMSLGRRLLSHGSVAAAEGLHREGVRRVRLTDPVDLCAGTGVPGVLVLLRELTARGIAVDWTARCVDECAAMRRYVHLYPPREVSGVDERIGREWRDTFFLCKCVVRSGPGFLQVRDRRFGRLELFTIDDPQHMAAIEAMTEGTPVDRVPDGVRSELAAADLVAEHAGVLWWLPMAIYRWPFPPMIV